MTLQQASAYLNIPANTLRWWRTSGTGPRAYRLGGRVFYDRADLDSWADAEKLATIRGG
ncbi:helix-turn-helix domain-containing protein [Mycolicibacter heraklionensis]|uniref:helix-turn-helix domain-containing protein n=1 Tax=Mycolicibacter heraklionensis TaxID=512402 RepID=UPI0009EDDC24|nr:helix-turn-helix domain-containing protein [Mycolicibacter heraklionensis]